MPKGLPFTEKKKIILDYLIDSKVEATQNELAHKFYTELGYLNPSSAKVSIGQMLLELKKEKKVKFTEKKPLRGAIHTKFWYDGQLQRVS